MGGQSTLLMHDNWGAHRGPIEQPLGVVDGDIDTTVADGRAEAVVPVSAVDGVVARIVHGVGNVANIVACTSHARNPVFGLHRKGANAGWR